MMRKKIPDLKERLDNILVKRGAKNNKQLQAEVVNEILEHQKKDLSKENIAIKQVIFSEKEKTVFAEPSRLIVIDQAARKNSSSGSTLDEVGEENLRKKTDQSGAVEAPFFLFGEPDYTSPAGRIDLSFHDDIAPYDDQLYRHSNNPTTVKKDVLRQGLEGLLEEEWDFSRIRHSTFSNYSGFNSSEKGFNHLFHQYDNHDF